MATSRIEVLRGLVEQDPANARVRHMLANELGNAGEWERALAEYETLVQADPDYIPGYFQAGRLAEGRGELEVARAWLERGLEAAARTGDKHAANEMQSALELLGL
jgi:tetratricopeptide (TPR) repeat protein